MDATQPLTAVFITQGVIAFGLWLTYRVKASNKHVDAIAASNTEAFAEMRRINTGLDGRIESLEGEVRKCHAERDVFRDEAAALRAQLIERQVMPKIEGRKKS